MADPAWVKEVQDAVRPLAAAGHVAVAVLCAEVTQRDHWIRGCRATRRREAGDEELDRPTGRFGPILGYRQIAAGHRNDDIGGHIVRAVG